MDLEDLSKSQIVLLAVMVSFITAIATGIATVSLLDKSSEGIGQTVHKVVERTVEKVSAPSEEENNAAAAGASEIEGKTVVVKENNVLTDSIEKNIESLVRIRRYSASGLTEHSTSTATAQATSSDASEKEINAKNSTFVSLGTVLSKDGVIVAPGSAINTEESLGVELHNGKFLKLSVVYEDSGLVLLKPKSDTEKISFNPVNFAKSSETNLGKRVIAISGADRTKVATGIISSLPKKKFTTSADDSTERIDSVVVDISAAEVMPGSPLVSIFSKIVGINITGAKKGAAEYVPAWKLRRILKKYRNNAEGEKNKSKEENKQENSNSTSSDAIENGNS